MRTLLMAGVAVFGWVGISQATTITFNSSPNSSYFVSSVTSDGFVATENLNENRDEYGSTPMGTNVSIDGAGPSNGTIHLDSWTNDGSHSIWTLTQQNGAAFSISQFDFEAGAYGSYAAATGLTVTARTAAGATVMQAFGPASTFTTEFLTGTFSNVLSVTFDAAGFQNRAGYDNIVVNAGTAAVPEPASLALLGLGLAGIAAARRRRSI